MKAAFTVDGVAYLFKKEEDQVAVQLYRVQGFKKPVQVANFPTWKKQDWLVSDISDESKGKVASVVEAFRRIANSATLGVILGK